MESFKYRGLFFFVLGVPALIRGLTGLTHEHPEGFVYLSLASGVVLLTVGTLVRWQMRKNANALAVSPIGPSATASEPDGSRRL